MRPLYTSFITLSFCLVPASVAMAQGASEQFPSVMDDLDAAGEEFKPSSSFGIVPTGSVSATINTTNPNIDKPLVGGHVGINIYPMLQIAPIFVSANLRMELATEIEGRPIDFMPQARLGYSWIGDTFDNEFFKLMMPTAQLFTTFGYRLERNYRTDLGRKLQRQSTWRATLGVTAPLFGSASAFMCLQGVPLPNAIEVGIERDPDLDETDILILISIGI